MTFVTKSIRHYPHHLRHVATLPWEIKYSNFLQIFSRPRYGRKCKKQLKLRQKTIKNNCLIDLGWKLCIRINASWLVGNIWWKRVPTHAISVVLALMASVKIRWYWHKFAVTELKHETKVQDCMPFSQSLTTGECLCLVTPIRCLNVLAAEES